MHEAAWKAVAPALGNVLFGQFMLGLSQDPDTLKDADPFWLHATWVIRATAVSVPYLLCLIGQLPPSAFDDANPTRRVLPTCNVELAGHTRVQLQFFFPLSCRGRLDGVFKDRGQTGAAFRGQSS